MMLRAPNFSVSDKGRFTVESPMVYRWIAMGVRITVPTGFRTDFATIPRPMRALISVNGRHRLPALLHDYLYMLGGLLPTGERYTRKQADMEFRIFMKAMGVPLLQRSMMYRAVRLFGGMFYRDIDGVITWAVKKAL